MMQTEHKMFKKQEEALQKAATIYDEPVKAKHVRNAVITTWDVKNANIFWTAMMKMPLGTHQIMTYKCMIIVHKLLHDGHPSVIPATYHQKTKLQQLGGMWAHQSGAFAPLVVSYIRFIVQKVDFHHKYQGLPGDLNNEIDAIGVTKLAEVGNAYTFLADCFDMQDTLMNLGASSLASLNLRLSPAQCENRASCLIPISWESGAFFKIACNLLQMLHKELDLDALSGHDERFVEQWYKLQKFYKDVSTLTYIKSMVNVPEIIGDPPQWLKYGAAPVAPVQPVVDFTPPDVSHLKDPDAALLAEIQRLKYQINQLLAEMDRLKGDNIRLHDIIDRLNQEGTITEESAARARTRFGEMEDLIAKQKDALEVLSSANDELAQKEEQFQNADKKILSAESRFKKMQEMYNKLRADHLVALKATATAKNALVDEKKFNEKKNSDVEKWKKEVESLRAEKALVDKLVAELQNAGTTEASEAAAKHHSAMAEMQAAFDEKMSAAEAAAAAATMALQMELDELREKSESDAATAAAEKEAMEKARKASQAQSTAIVNGTVVASKSIIQQALDEFLLDGYLGNTNCTPHECIESAKAVKATGAGLTQTITQLFSEMATGSMSGESVVEVPMFATKVAHTLRDLKGVTRLAAEDDLVAALSKSGVDLAQVAMQLLASVSVAEGEDVSAKGTELSTKNGALETAATAVVSEVDKLVVRGVEDSGQLEDELTNQMSAAAAGIAAAAKRLEELLEKAKRESEGLALNVSESILAGSQALMECIRMLVEKATTVQDEIVNSGRGGANAKEFYNQNHTWAEGLISAAREVGWGANVLVEASEEAVSGNGKFEALIAAANEIMSSTAHLVTAARVKAEHGSKKQAQLEGASTDVRNATRELVKAAKMAGEMLAESQKKTYDTLSDNQAKRAEMQKQIKALELEKELETVRKDLFSLRKLNYNRDTTKGMNDGTAPPS